MSPTMLPKLRLSQLNCVVSCCPGAKDCCIDCCGIDCAIIDCGEYVDISLGYMGITFEVLGPGLGAAPGVPPKDAEPDTLSRDTMFSPTTLSIMLLTASHGLVWFVSLRSLESWRARSARCRSGASNKGFRNSERTCMMAWNAAWPPVHVSWA